MTVMNRRPPINMSAPREAEPVEEQPEARVPLKPRATSIQLTYHGALVTFAFSAAVDLSVAEIEQRIDKMLERDGWAGATPSDTAS